MHLLLERHGAAGSYRNSTQRKLLSAREHHSALPPATQLGSIMFMPDKCLSEEGYQKDVKCVNQLVQQSCYGKYPQNGDRSLSHPWGQRPQNVVFVSMTATDYSCPYDGEKSIIGTFTENTQKASFLQKVFSMAVYF